VPAHRKKIDVIPAKAGIHFFLDATITLDAAGAGLTPTKAFWNQGPG
jgi:hypothetical protein